MSSRHEDALRELMASAGMSTGEASQRLADARSADYWRALFPAFGIEGKPAIALRAIDHAAVQAAVSGHRKDSYFRLPPLLDASALAQLNACVDAVTAAGWPPVFAFAYDELWSLVRIPAVVRVTEAALGGGYRQIPHVWVHVVPAVEGGRGWMPHVDGFEERRLSVWIALTDATTDNGCMHVVPKASSPQTGAPTFWKQTGEPIARSEVLRILQSVRALPGPAGAALGWTFDTLHWGGPSRHGAAPRRAVSFELIAADAAPTDDEEPLLDATAAPPLNARLRAIAAGIEAYKKFEPGLVRYQRVAALIAKEVPGTT